MAKAGLAQEVKERPIIFGPESARAILEDRKTQTRRVIQPQPTFDGKDWWWNHRNGAASKNTLETLRAAKPVELTDRYGDVGDRLWVRERFRIDPRPVQTNGTPFPAAGESWDFIITYADGESRDLTPEENRQVSRSLLRARMTAPSHMARWASRITLELTDVRVERLNEITPHAACAEGVTMFCQQHVPSMDLCHAAFAKVWDELNAKRGFGWDKNPWVWVLSFRRLPNDARA